MSTPTTGRPYNCGECGQTVTTTEMNGRVPLYCPDCRPRVGKRGGTGGGDSGTLVYRLALSVTAFQLGVDRARQALLQAGLDGRANLQDLQRAITLALAALDDAEANRLAMLTAADLLTVPAPVDAPQVSASPD